jgi:hypothetical protein
MWLRDVFLHKVAWTLADGLLFGDDSDTSTTTGGCWLENIHFLEVVHFSFVAESFVVLWEQICIRTYFKVFAISSSLTLDVSPEVAFVTNVPCSSKMIYLLILIHILEFTWSNQASPQGIPGTAFT